MNMKIKIYFILSTLFMISVLCSFAQKVYTVNNIKDAEQVLSIVDSIIAIDNSRIPYTNIFAPDVYRKVVEDKDIQIPIIVYLAQNRIVTYMVSYVSKTKQVNIFEDEFAQIPVEQTIIVTTDIKNTYSKYRKGFVTNSLDLLRLMNKKILEKEYGIITNSFDKAVQNNLQGRYDRVYGMQTLRQNTLQDSLALNPSLYKNLDMGDELCFMYQQADYKLVNLRPAVKVMSGFVENTNSDKTRLQIRVSYKDETLNYDTEFMEYFPKNAKKGDIIWINVAEEYKTTWYIKESFYGGIIKYITKCKK